MDRLHVPKLTTEKECQLHHSFRTDSEWHESVLYIILLFEILSGTQTYIKFPQMKLSLSANTKSEWGILFQRVPEGKLHQPKQNSYCSLRWQMETLNNYVTAIIFGNGKKLISLRCNVLVSCSLGTELHLRIYIFVTNSLGKQLFAFTAFWKVRAKWEDSASEEQ